MDQIPLQTLKPIEKVSTEDQINNLIVEVASVNRNFKPTVRSRREYEADDTIDFDSAFEKVLNKIDSDVENIHLTETLPKIETELNLWVNEYKSLLEEFHKLREDSVRDQAYLKQSDDQIREKLSRVEIVQNIKNSLLKEVKKLCLALEKNKADADDKFKRSTQNFKEIIRYLNRGFETERLGFQSTNEVLRKLEHSLRDTFNQYQNVQATAEVLQDEFKKSKAQLHACQKEKIDEEKKCQRAAVEIMRLEIELLDARERANYAEQKLTRLGIKF